MTYAPTLESPRSHPVPAWFEDASLGVRSRDGQELRIRRGLPTRGLLE
ncbi:MAG: hypothetical protein QNK05_06585 [Myxococcota bacterium]|nr:hypothetical protein [Myxococcota bacterium]